MKKVYLIFAILTNTLFLFGQDSEILEKIDSIECVVVKIDSVDNFYLIYLQEKDNNYEIISRKMENTCSNLQVGKSYRCNLIAISPKMMNYYDYNQHIGGGTCIKVDWGINLYQAQEICGLCYETDSIKLKKCKSLLIKQNRFENNMLYIYFHYTSKKEREMTFINFIEKQKMNSIPFTLDNIKNVPIYSMPNDNEVDCWIFSDSINQKTFEGKILFKYKSFYFIQGNYINDSEIEILGWIDKKNLKKINYKNVP